MMFKFHNHFQFKTKQRKKPNKTSESWKIFRMCEKIFLQKM